MKTDIWMPLYIGDYMSDTMHLTTEQHGAYLLLLMAAWKSGGNLPVCDKKLSVISRLPSDKWAEIKDDILEFFDMDGEILTQKRLQSELARAIRHFDSRRENGKKGGRPKKDEEEKPTGSSQVIQDHNREETPLPSPSQLNTKSNSKEKPARDKPARRLVVEKPDGVDSQVWADFVAQRNVKRAPITQTALNGIKKQAAIAGIPIEDALSMICERGWTGFKADWVATGGQHAKSDRTGKPSLAERVSAGARAAIASIDAREMACRAVGEDGAHLRASLDGDFRGDGRG